MPRLRTWSLVVLTAATLGLAGCGSSSASSSTTTTGASTATTSSGATTIATIPVQDRSPAGTFGTEPTVTVPSGSPPTQLESTDLITGTGPAAKAGDTITVQYVLATYSSGKVVQASWTSQPFSFTLGEGQVIPGWDQGVVGMKVGGRRELIIPPSLAYKAAGQPPTIPKNATLVFVVDLLSVKK